MPTLDLLNCISAFSLGFFGAGHCLGMCGGISASLGMSAKPDGAHSTIIINLGFQLGRLSSYTLLGAAFGLLAGWSHENFQSIGIALRIIAGLMLIAMGLYLSSWWMGLQFLEKQGFKLWRKIQPLTQKLLPPSTPIKSLAVGLLWGFLPCGLIYSALIWASTTSHWAESALLMMLFGLGTLPAMFASGILASQIQSLARNQKFRAITGIAVIAFGLWTLQSLVFSSHQQHSDNHESSGLHQRHLQ